MDIILQENFPSLGYVGDKVKVKGGYARNYLIPKGIAVEASSRNARVLKHKLSAISAKKAKLKAAASEIGDRLAKLVLDFTLKIGSQGKSFGAITAKDIELALIKENFSIERRQIKLSEPIKNRGEFKVDVKLHSEVVIPVAVRVAVEVNREKMDAQEEGDAKGDHKKKGGKRGAPKSETNGAPFSDLKEEGKSGKPEVIN